jgi:protein gp37
VQLRPDKLELPLHWRKPRRIFVNSMSDLFHDQVPDDYIAHVFAVMQSCAAHTFQLLTKRHARMRSLLNDSEFWSAVTDFGVDIMRRRPSREQLWPDHGERNKFLPNVRLGVSTENQQWADIRIPALLATPAAVRWISAEPLLGPIDLDIPRCQNGCDVPFFDQTTNTWRCVDCANDGGSGELAYRWWLDPCPENGGINWVVVGGESGNGARPMHPDWVRSLRDQCHAAGVPFFFKQWGAWRSYIGGAYREPHTYVARATGEVADEQRAMQDGGSWAGVWKLGKKRAGRELDGRTWDQFPASDTTKAT